jgi:hypothetical protein
VAAPEPHSLRELPDVVMVCRGRVSPSDADRLRGSVRLQSRPKPFRGGAVGPYSPEDTGGRIEAQQ